MGPLGCNHSAKSFCSWSVHDLISKFVFELPPLASKTNNDKPQLSPTPLCLLFTGKVLAKLCAESNHRLYGSFCNLPMDSEVWEPATAFHNHSFWHQMPSPQLSTQCNRLKPLPSLGMWADFSGHAWWTYGMEFEKERAVLQHCGTQNVCHEMCHKFSLSPLRSQISSAASLIVIPMH